MTTTAASLGAAAQRLAGHVVATPLIGTPWLGGEAALPDVRWKPEVLQPGGSAWYRGYQHFLLRQFGAPIGVVYAGPPQRLLAAALAAAQHRLPFVACLEHLPPPPLQALLPGGAECVLGGAQSAAQIARSRGYLRLPDAEHEDVHAGLATIALELARGLPQHCSEVLAPTDLAPVLRRAFAAVDRAVEVRSPEAHGVRPGLAAALQHQHALALPTGALALLSAALAAEPNRCVAVVVDG